MIVTLDVVSGPEQGRSFHFSETDSFLVGRSLKAHLQLDPVADPYISRTHCLVEVRPPRCILTDLGSTNGTRVNENPIRQAEVGDGDLINVGHTSIRIRVDEAQADALPDAFATSPFRGSPKNPQQPAKVVSTAPKAELRRLAHGPASCDGCGADVSRAADKDTMTWTFQEVHYLCQECMRRQSDPSIEAPQIGVYRILSEIGRGGMGVVYKAAHSATGRLCAIKSLLPESARDEAARRLFEREIDVQTKVEHPHLVRVWDRARDAEESLFFVTEYMGGGDLEFFASKVNRGPVEPAMASRLICQILSGLEELHERGMIHRDLKPSNFLLSRAAADPGCMAKISDYGLAKCFEDAGNSVFAYTNVGHVAGSMLFMAPEQITNFRFVRPPADVYSVGVSLYYLLTATYTVDFLAPQKTGRRRHPVEMIVEDPPVPLLQRNSKVPERLATVVDKAVQKDPENRFQTAYEFNLELERVVVDLGWEKQS